MLIATLLLSLTPPAAQAAPTLTAPVNAPVRSTEVEHGPRLVDAELEPWRRDLLALAFDAASAFPLEPHVKNRSRAQEQVAETALELGQLALANEFAFEIANWRRGALEASLALALIGRGRPDAARALLKRAAAAGEGAGQDAAQGWRRDRILARLAIAEGRLGRAIDPTLEIEASEQGELRAERLRRADAEGLELELELLARAVDIQDFEGTKAAIQAYAELHDRFYEDLVQRARFEALNRAAWTGIPIPLAVQAELTMGETALAHGEPAEAQRLIDGALERVASSRWVPEQRVPVEAQLAALNYRAGRRAEARLQANAAFAQVDEDLDRIISIYRARALIPLAEAFMILEEPATAGTLYLRALEEAWVNPNSRPRAEDFARLCCSMASTGYEPGAPLVERLAVARDQLGDPW